MQRALLYLAITACFLRSAFAEPSLKQAVKQQMSIFEQSKNKGLPTVYPELAQRMEAMFLRYPATHIAITGTSEKGRSETGHIYICGEDV